METLALMLAAVVIAIVIGLPLGILAGRSDRATAILSPILDVMQIMPTLAYLVPVTALFFIGAAPAAVATLIYAIPPAVRITSLGIRGVPGTSVEAARSLGSTDRQVLSKVQLPLAMRAIGLGINQTIMLALSMVVITGLIGAPGLGRNLAIALSKVNVSQAFEAGLAIVILAIIMDRLTYRGQRVARSARHAGAAPPRAVAGSRSVRRSRSSAPASSRQLFVDATRFPDAISGVA